MTKMKHDKDLNELFPVKVGKQSYLISRDIIKEAIAMRDRISADFAAIYLQFKGVSMDVALNILSMPASSCAMAHQD